mgnify:CR=1 FL=1
MKDKNMPSPLQSGATGKTPLNQDGFFSSHPFVRSVVCGGLAGITTGVVVAPFEHLKVLIQTANPPMKWSDKPAYLNRISENFPHMIRSLPQFSANFGVICAMEFSMNASIGKKYGEVPGIAASAITGGTFLTIADHLMFYTSKNVQPLTAAQKLLKLSPSALFTGWSPMVLREFLFMLSVCHTGPMIGKQLQTTLAPELDEEQTQNKWTFLGRLVSGLATTAVSHPFDVVARQLQIKLFKTHFNSNLSVTSPFNRPGIVSVLKGISFNQLYVGVGPRLALATFGGAMVGGMNKYFEEKLHSEENQTSSLVKSEKIAQRTTFFSPKNKPIPTANKQSETNSSVTKNP